MKIYMNTPLPEEFLFDDCLISKTSYFNHLVEPKGLLNLIKYGSKGRNLFSKLRNPEYLHTLYLEKNKHYFNYLGEFKERFSKYDVIVMNPGVDLVHPEYLNKEFKNSLKVLHFIDDPHTTYSYGLPFSWAFDAATYISPSYSEDYSMEDILRSAGFINIKWTPHCVTNIGEPRWTIDQLRDQLSKRNNKAIYVGNYYKGKQARLHILKNSLGNKFNIYGRYPLNGFSFSAFSSLAGIPSIYRVKKLSDHEREEAYANYAVGINMHLSHPALETGNARLYELAFRGVAQIVDSSSSSLVGKIFIPGQEVLTYESMNECIDLTRGLLANEELRISLALNAYKRACREYRFETCLSDQVAWFKTLI